MKDKNFHFKTDKFNKFKNADYDNETTENEDSELDYDQFKSLHLKYSREITFIDSLDLEEDNPLR